MSKYRFGDILVHKDELDYIIICEVYHDKYIVLHWTKVSLSIEYIDNNFVKITNIFNIT